MPTYDYACKGCGYRFERFEGIHDDAPKECPKCHKKKGRRMIGTGAGLIFKGSGFYATDSKGGAKKGESDGSKKDADKKAADKKEPVVEKKKEEKEQKK